MISTRNLTVGRTLPSQAGQVDGFGSWIRGVAKKLTPSPVKKAIQKKKEQIKARRARHADDHKRAFGRFQLAGRALAKVAHLGPNHPTVRKATAEAAQAKVEAQQTLALVQRTDTAIKQLDAVEANADAQPEMAMKIAQQVAVQVEQPGALAGLGSFKSFVAERKSTWWQPGTYKILSARKEAKNTVAQTKQYDKGVAELKIQIAEADKIIADMQQAMNQYGLSGLGATWFARTFTPRKVAQRGFDAAKRVFEQLEKELNDKLDLIQSMQQKLEAHEAKLNSSTAPVRSAAPAAAAPQPATQQAGGMALGIVAALMLGGALLFGKPKEKEKATA